MLALSILILIFLEGRVVELWELWKSDPLTMSHELHEAIATPVGVLTLAAKFEKEEFPGLAYLVEALNLKVKGLVQNEDF